MIDDLSNARNPRRKFMEVRAKRARKTGLREALVSVTWASGLVTRV